MINDYIIKRILDATKIEDVVGDFVELKQKGARYVGLCPFHDDRHATNFVVYPRKNCYRCFACDAKGDAVKFLQQINGMSFVDAIRWLGKKVGVDVDDVAVDMSRVAKREAPPPLPTLYLPDEMVKAREWDRPSNFVSWLTGIPWNQEERRRMVDVLSAYHVGTTIWGDTIFWQIDSAGGVRDGKIMKYRIDGHRDKDSKYSISWVTPKLFKHGYYDEKQWEVRRCLFGLHLLDKYPSAEVHVVESEKTAIFCSIYFGQPERHIWMATAGKGNLTRSILQPLIDARRTIALHPDKDGEADWQEKLTREIQYKKAYINDTVMVLQWMPEDGDKADMADVLERVVRERRSKETMKIAEVMNIINQWT